MLLKIVQVGEPVLRKAGRPLTSQEILTDDTQRLIRDMQETMRDAPGAVKTPSAIYGRNKFMDSIGRSTSGLRVDR